MCYHYNFIINLLNSFFVFIHHRLPCQRCIPASLLHGPSSALVLSLFPRSSQRSPLKPSQASNGSHCPWNKTQTPRCLPALEHLPYPSHGCVLLILPVFLKPLYLKYHPHHNVSVSWFYWLHKSVSLSHSFLLFFLPSFVFQHFSKHTLFPPHRHRTLSPPRVPSASFLVSYVSPILSHPPSTHSQRELLPTLH